MTTWNHRACVETSNRNLTLRHKRTGARRQITENQYQTPYHRRTGAYEDQLSCGYLCLITLQTSNVDPDLGPGAQLTSITHVDKKLQISCKCLPKPTSCRDVVSTHDRIVVTLASGLEVMCDTKTDGGGWIIFQRRIHGDVDFYKNWQEYRDGFGDYNIGEFYLGNENIFNLTSSRKYELRFDLEYENKKYFAHYSDFQLLDENNKYKLVIGSYSGNAGDSMRRHVNKFFTTFDKDNDDSQNDNCAIIRRGAWWYQDCADVNLNGNWGWGAPNGAFWDNITVWESVSFSEIKIREID
uniref:Fibrinogen C-terminal domain-containing protein n=1 Tax=Biomphalaria glabrata TaxID=6526 RepID=A0A2C9KJA5_BIOGL